MDKRIIFFGLFGVLASFGDIQALQYPPLTAQQTATLNQQLGTLIAHAEKRVKDLEQRVASRRIAPVWTDKLELENAIIQLEVKKTLVNNFKGTESLQSPVVQQKLLSILSKPSISESDLADLQNTVLEEKAKIRAEKTKNTSAGSTGTTGSAGAAGGTGSSGSTGPTPSGVTILNGSPGS